MAENFDMYKDFQEVQQTDLKYEYFMAGVVGALCAYIGNNYHPERLGFNPSLLQLLSIICFFSSFASCLYIIRKLIFLSVSNKLQRLIVTNPDMSHDAYQESKRDLALISNTLRLTYKRVKRAFDIRNALLLIGIIFLVVSKQIEPYFNNGS